MTSGEAKDLKLFDGYMAVDWSANSKPKQGKDSIWIASRGEGGIEAPENPATRWEAVGRIEELLEKATAAGWRLLVGFDFPFGYPEGTARMLTGRAGWEAVWSRIAEVIEDDSRNENNRFDAAALLNAAFVVKGPFWGNGLRRDISGLPREKPAAGWGVDLPANLRHAESEVKGAQEVWKLNGVGSVGGQALTGIAALERLRNRVDAQVWPFQTLGEGGSHVLAEIYPSLVEPHPGSEVKDAGQVDAVAAALQQLDNSGELERHLCAPSQMPAAVCKEEGLILGMQDRVGFQRAAKRGRGDGVGGESPAGRLARGRTLPRAPRRESRGAGRRGARAAGENVLDVDLVLDYLADNGIRATYGAVGEAVGIHHRHLKNEPQFYRSDPRTAWVVYAKTRQPPPEVHGPRSSDSSLFTDGGKLVMAVLAGKAR